MRRGKRRDKAVKGDRGMLQSDSHSIKGEQAQFGQKKISEKAAEQRRRKKDGCVERSITEPGPSIKDGKAAACLEPDQNINRTTPFRCFPFSSRSPSSLSPLPPSSVLLFPLLPLSFQSSAAQIKACEIWICGVLGRYFLLFSNKFANEFSQTLANGALGTGVDTSSPFPFSSLFTFIKHEDLKVNGLVSLSTHPDFFAHAGSKTGRSNKFCRPTTSFKHYHLATQVTRQQCNALMQWN